MSSRGIVIKIDNRETDLIPLIERRVEANLLGSPISETSSKKSGCVVPLHMFQNVEANNEILEGHGDGDVTEPRENAKLHKMKIEQLHIGDIIFEDE